MRLNVLAFALGVVLLQMQPGLPGIAVACSLAAAGGLPFVVRLFLGRKSMPSRAWRAALLLGALAAGFGSAALRAELRLADALPTAWEGQDIEIVGVVAELPQGFARGERFTFDVEQVLTPQASVPARIALSWYRAADDGSDEEVLPLSRLRAGERWRLRVRLKRPHGNANPAAFDYEGWLLERGVRATGYVRPGIAPERLDAFVANPDYAIERMRQAVRDRFLSALPSAPYAGVIAALAVGDQRAIQGELWNVFSRTGTTHLMSISYL